MTNLHNYQGFPSKVNRSGFITTDYSALKKFRRETSLPEDNI